MSDALCKYPGGKRSLLKYLLPLIPEHGLYVEMFCGAAALFFAKDRSRVEVLNDINSDLVNAFRVARLHNDALVEEMFLRVNSREEMKDEGQTDIQRAANFLIRRAISFGADGDSYGVQRKSGGGATTSLGRVRAAISRIGERLDGVAVENLDWRHCFRIYDTPETFFFCDPPYIGTEQRAYKSWEAAEFAELVEKLRKAKGRWLLTINDCAAARAALKGLRVRRVERARSLNCKEGAGRLAELIVTPK